MGGSCATPSTNRGVAFTFALTMFVHRCIMSVMSGIFGTEAPVLGSTAKSVDGGKMAKNVSMHLSLTSEAAQVLRRLVGERGRGQFVSRLIMEHNQRERASEDKRLLDTLMDAIRAQAVEHSQAQPQLQPQAHRRWPK